MFHQKELARLRAQKELLVLHSSANRLVLFAQWQQLKSPEQWREEAGRLIRRHPLFATGLAAVGGMMAVRSLFKPKVATGGLGKIGQMVSLAMVAWKLMRRPGAKP